MLRRMVPVANVRASHPLAVHQRVAAPSTRLPAAVTG